MKKMMIFLLITFVSNAQEHNIWYFGGLAGLDFNQGTPIAIGDGKIITNEGCATISDGNGNLLFYTDGIRVWNKNHQVMENGNGLKGHPSSTQSALIIPKPGSNTVYYLFTTTAEAGPGGVCYSVVDMQSAAGLGSVIEKNTLLHTPTCEKLAAAWHINGTDIWVMGHEFGNNVFTAYLVTVDGIDTTPITSSTGVITDANGAGHLRFSPTGKRLAMTSRGKATQLFDFDPATGSVQNPVSLAQDNYGVEFSASGTILYVGTNGVQESSLYQYQLQTADIMSTATELLSVNNNSGFRIGALQRGPDNKIYVARHQATALSVINFPDIQGIGCGLTENSVSLFSGSMASCQLGLPNNSLAPAYRVNINRQLACEGQESLFWVSSPQGVPDTVLWEFGDGNSSTAPNPYHTYLHSGNYTVRLTATLQGITRVVETIVTIIDSVPINQPAAMRACEEDNGTAHFNLATQNATVVGNEDPNDYNITYHATFQHAASGSESLPLHYGNVSNPQTIYIRMEVKESGCFAITSFELIVESKPIINMEDRYTFCSGNQLLLSAPAGFSSYLWSTGETTQTIRIGQAGNYTITVSQGPLLCENSKTITVYESESPVISQIKIRDWTVNQNTVTVNTTTTGDYEYSLDGTAYQDSPVFYGLQSGVYTVYVKDKNGCGFDTKDIILLMYPKFFTPNGDGINDYWAIQHARYEPNMKVSIFDRYGKLITSFSGNNTGWNGTLNGNNLPATDYWFVVERQDGRQHKGHFSLLR